MSDRSVRILASLQRPQEEYPVLSVAAHLARDREAEIILLRVITPPRVPTVPTPDLLPIVDMAERQAERELRSAAAALDGLVVRRVVLVGTRPTTEIRRWLRDHAVDFVVVATERPSLWQRLVGGGRIDAVQRSTDAAVIIASDWTSWLRRQA